MIKFGFVVEKKGDTPGLMRQVHGTELVMVKSEEHARELETSPPNADGLVTWQRKLTLPVFTADCVPVLLHSEKDEGPIAAVHAGWRGARSGVVASAVAAMNIPKKEIVAILGPSILGCCFEVRQDFVQSFHEAKRNIDPYLERRDDRLFCDLVQFVIEEELAGVGQIDARLSRCTYCSAPPLPSYRRNGSTEIRLRSWIRRD